MKISILCSNSDHPVNQYLNEWIDLNKDIHDINVVRKKSDLTNGDFLFLVSCSEIINEVDRASYKYCLVLHASDLPEGRGWSPHVWDIINGKDYIILTILEAENKVDSGRIWKKINIPMPRHALWNEINESLFKAEIELINYSINNFKKISPLKQNLEQSSNYYPRRTPEDSRIDPELSLSEQFNKIRVCDPLRFPAFFELYGFRYKLVLEKMDEK